MKDERMVHMANQIAQFFQTEPPDEASKHVATHLKQFWEPRMLRQLHGYIAGGGAGLHNLVLEAAKSLH